MFRQRVYESVFTSEIMKREHEGKFFGNLGDDVVFESVIRALLYPRMGEDDRLFMRYSGIRTSSSYSGSDDPGDKKAFIRRATYFDTIIEENSFNYVNVPYIHTYEFLASNFEVIEGFKKIEKVTVFFQKNFKAACFCDAETRTTVLFVFNATTEVEHYLGCAALAYFPWYFDPKKGITDLERRLIESLRNKTPQEFNCCMYEYEKILDLKEKMYKQLHNFETTTERNMLVSYKSTLDSIDTSIEEYERRIQNELHRRRELEITYTALEEKIRTGDGEGDLMGYFKANRKLVLEKVSDTGITFGIRSQVTIYDEDLAESVIDNPNSFVYEASSFSHDDTKRLLEAIFIDKEVQLNFCEAFNMNCDGNVSPLEGHHFSSAYNDCMPNPHIYYHGCLGNYRQEINAAVKARNYIGVIEQCVASCSNLNWGDSIVMKEFIEYICGKGRNMGNLECFVLPTGEITNTKGVIEWLNKDKEEESDG